MKSTRPINKLFQEADGELAMLVTRSRLLQRLTKVLRKQLENELAEHCYIGNIEQDVLVILADTAARASKLRFHTPQLLEKLPRIDAAFSGIKSIKVKVLNYPGASHTADPPATNGPEMNEENARGLQTLAEHIDDAGLHDALLRLARHAAKE